ncbi:MAG: hypothetical protein EA359_08200 [Balneolaceae bacterium]|nr:MAG: hypothetical protein EA359_08200 [Balneolaceae bacterium]
MQESVFKYLLLIIMLSVIGIACNTDDPFRIPPPDLTTVPEPFDLQNIEPMEIIPGVQVFIHEEGYGPFYVTARDEVWIYKTLRTDEGDIIYSTFSDGRVDPIPISMSIAGNYQNVFNFTILLGYNPGFKAGMLGMREGEKRTIIVQPEQGFANIPSNSLNAAYRNNKLIYDIRVSRIEPS